MIKKLITLDSTLCSTDLCILGEKYPTDKSPLNTHKYLHKHAYTPIYSLLFANLRYRPVNIAEIGIYHNMSVLCWRDFFPSANIYALDFDESLLRNGERYNLSNVFYSVINVKDTQSIETSFNNINQKMDIIIDDSTHQPHDQINVIKSCVHYLNAGGYLIIEDIFKNVDTNIFSSILDEMTNLISDYFFIDANHKKRYSGEWDNDRLLIIIKK
jgi:hypothetical protein